MKRVTIATAEEGLTAGRPTGQMQRNPRVPRKCLIGTAVLAAVAAGYLAFAPASKFGPSPVIINYVGNGSFTNAGGVLSGPTFWLSNHTSSAVCVSLSCVEVRSGTNWNPYARPRRQLTLGPNGGAYATIEFAYQQYPTNAWRLSGNAGEQLEGAAAALAWLRYSPGILWRSFRARDARMAAGLVAKGNTWYGKHRLLVSDEVLDSKSIRGP